MQQLNIPGLFLNFIRKLYHIAHKSKVFTIIPKMFDDPSIGVPDLYFRTVHVVIFILFKLTHALFLKHIHI